METTRLGSLKGGDRLLGHSGLLMLTIERDLSSGFGEIVKVVSLSDGSTLWLESAEEVVRCGSGKPWARVKR